MCGHDRFGDLHLGQYPQWDADHPIDLVGYSLGATTARYLQHLLITQAFTDLNGNTIPTSGDWVRSLVSVQGVNNGTQCVYPFGLGLHSLDIQPFTFLWFGIPLLYFVYWLLGSWLDYIYPLSVGHWRCSREHGTSLSELFTLWPMISDNAVRDLTTRRTQELNKIMAQTMPHPNTTYVACVAQATNPIIPYKWSLHLPSWALLTSFPEIFIMLPLAVFVGLFGSLTESFAGLEVPADETASAWHSNQVASDGVVSVAGQKPPAQEDTVPGTFGSFRDIAQHHRKGVWYNLDMGKTWNHMLSMKNGQRQRTFFADMQDFLRAQ